MYKIIKVILNSKLLTIRLPFVRSSAGFKHSPRCVVNVSHISLIMCAMNDSSHNFTVSNFDLSIRFNHFNLAISFSSDHLAHFFYLLFLTMGISRDNRDPLRLLTEDIFDSNTGVEHFTEQHIGFHYYFVRLGRALEEALGLPFEDCLAIVVASHGGANLRTLDAEEAMLAIVGNDIPHSLYLNAMLLVHSNYVIVSNNAYRMARDRVDLGTAASLIMGVMAFATTGDSLMARINGHSLRQNVLVAGFIMMSTLRNRGTHPAHDGTVYPSPEGLPSISDLAEINDDELGGNTAPSLDDSDDDSSSE